MPDRSFVTLTGHITCYRQSRVIDRQPATTLRKQANAAKLPQSPSYLGNYQFTPAARPLVAVRQG